MTEISKSNQRPTDRQRGLAKHSVQLAEDYLRQSKYCRRELLTAIQFATEALGALAKAPDEKLQAKAIKLKASAMLALGEFGQACRWLGSLGHCSEVTEDLLVKALILAGDSLRSATILSGKLQALSESGERDGNNFDSLKYQAARLLADSINMGRYESSLIADEALRMRVGFVEISKTISESIYNRFGFILGVIEARCALVQGKIGVAAEHLSYPADLLNSHNELRQSSAIMEYLATSGEISLLEGKPEAAAAHFSDLSVRFAFAEDSPVYFRRAIWGLIDSSAVKGRYDRLDQIKVVLGRRAGRAGALLADWCAVMNFYADARVGRQVDLGAWKEALKYALRSGALAYSEGLVHHLLRGFVIMTRPRASKKGKVLGAKIMTAVLEAIATDPDKIGVMDTWRLSRIVDRWFGEVVAQGLESRTAAAGLIVKILGDSPLFASKARVYQLVAKNQVASVWSAPRELVID